MADTAHSTLRNQAGATVTVYEMRIWPKDRAYYWDCAGCKYTDPGRNDRFTMQNRAADHANQCRFN